MDTYTTALTENHITHLFSEQEKYRQFGRFCDITLVVDEELFPAHRNILSCSSEYFRCLVEHDCPDDEDTEEDTGPRKVPVGMVSAKGMSEALDFIYTGDTHLTMGNIERAFFTADYLQLVTYRDLCMEFAQSHMGVLNVITFYRISKKYPIPALREQATAFLARNLWEVGKTRDFGLLDEEEIFELLSDRRLLFRSRNGVFRTGSYYETKALKLIGRWIRVDEDEREASAPRLIETVRRGLPVDGNEGVTEMKTYAVPVPIYYATKHPMKHGDHNQRLYGYDRITDQVVITCRDCPPDKWTIKALHLYFMDDWDNIQPVAGMDILYENIWNPNETYFFECGLGGQSGYPSQHIELHENERITRLVIRSGDMVHAITFYTSKGRTLGPFGTEAGGQVHTEDILRQPSHCGLYWHGLSYIRVLTKGRETFNRLGVYYAALDAQKYLEDFGKEPEDCFGR